MDLIKLLIQGRDQIISQFEYMVSDNQQHHPRQKSAKTLVSVIFLVLVWFESVQMTYKRPLFISPGPVHVLDSQLVTVCQNLMGTTVLEIVFFCFIFFVLHWINDLYEVSIELPSSSTYI